MHSASSEPLPAGREEDGDDSGEDARHAHVYSATLHGVALDLGYMTDAEFDEWVKPEEMTHPERRRGER